MNVASKHKIMDLDRLQTIYRLGLHDPCKINRPYYMAARRYEIYQINDVVSYLKQIDENDMTSSHMKI